MSKKIDTQKSDIKTSSGTFVRRTHTAKSLTVRETAIAPYLIAKLYKSPVPEGFKLDRVSLNKSFAQVFEFAEAIFVEAEASVKGLEVLAKKGDDEAGKQLVQVRKAVEEMYAFRKAGKFDEIRDMLRKVKAEPASKPAAVEKQKPAKKEQSKPATEQQLAA